MSVCVCVFARACMRVYTGMCTCECMCPLSPEESVGAPGTEVMGSCELPDVGVLGTELGPFISAVWALP